MRGFLLGGDAGSGRLGHGEDTGIRRFAEVQGADGLADGGRADQLDAVLRKPFAEPPRGDGIEPDSLLFADGVADGEGVPQRGQVL
jgi:hypothetical protein